MEDYKGCRYDVQVYELKNNQGYSGSVRVLYESGEGPITQELFTQEKIISTAFNEVHTRLSNMAKGWIDKNF